MQAVIQIETLLHAPMDRVWDLLQRPALLRHIAFPLLVFVSREPGGFPSVWADGPHRVFMLQFGVIPLGGQTIDISHGSDGGARWLRDNGRGRLVKRWDHRITISAEGKSSTRYTDKVEIDAGVLTPLVALFAHAFYRWRQRRWRAVAGDPGLQERLLGS